MGNLHRKKMKTITPESAKELIDSLADKELSFGCEVVEISHKKNHKISWVNKEKETYGLNGIGGAFEMKDRDIDIAILPKKTDIRQLMREKNREGLVYLRTEPTEILFKKYTK